SDGTIVFLRTVRSLMPRRSPQFPRFPYTTLFRSFASTNRYLTLTFDRLLFFQNMHRLAASNPGLLLLREDDNTVRRMNTKTGAGDRQSTRLNSSHEWISYAVFCLKNKHNRCYKN